MRKYQVKGLSQQNDWLLNPFVTIYSKGKITNISAIGTYDEYIDGYVLTRF